MSEVAVMFRETGLRQAQGRHGWFVPSEARVLDFGLCTRVEVSGHEANLPSIILELQPGDARALAAAITKIVGTA